MKQYKGAVCFIDILGIGNLTQGHIKLVGVDLASRSIREAAERPEQMFCAKLLVSFRKVLRSTKTKYPNVRAAQLSDCAFIWSESVLDVINAARHLMWEAIRAGLLCRGGMAFGEIIEPNRVDHSLGEFILGRAATTAVAHERAGKGCRIFSDIDLPSELSGKCSFAIEPFEGLKNPLDGTVVDEFRWYLYKDKIEKHNYRKSDILKAAIGLMELTALLRHSPYFNWNASSPEGAIHLKTSIESISCASALFLDTTDYCFKVEGMTTESLQNRSNKVLERIYQRYRSEIEAITSPSIGKKKKALVKRQ